MGFAPVNYSCMLDDINRITDRKSLIKALRTSTDRDKGYLNRLFGIAKNHDEK